VASWGGAASPAPSSAQGGVMGALDAGMDRPGHPHGAGASERVRQCGLRAWLPGSWRGCGSSPWAREARPRFGDGGDAACSRSGRARMSVVCHLVSPDGFSDGGAIPSASTQPSRFRYFGDFGLLRSRTIENTTVLDGPFSRPPIVGFRLSVIRYFVPHKKAYFVKKCKIEEHSG
jgi:hypothetical protein